MQSSEIKTSFRFFLLVSVSPDKVSLVIKISQTGPNFSVGLNFYLLNVSKNTMNPYQLMRKDQILDGVERFSRDHSTKCKYLRNRTGWCRKTCRDHPGAGALSL